MSTHAIMPPPAPGAALSAGLAQSMKRIQEQAAARAEAAGTAAGGVKTSVIAARIQKLQAELNAAQQQRQDAFRQIELLDRTILTTSASLQTLTQLLQQQPVFAPPPMPSQQ